jgi:dGTPase
LFLVDDLSNLPLAGDLVRTIAERYPALDAPRRGAELVRELISQLIKDVVAQTQSAIVRARPRSVEDVRDLGRPLVGFSAEIEAADRAIKQFLFAHMYRHARVVEIMTQAEAVVADLYARYTRDPEQLPAGWAAEQGTGGETDPARRIGDFIAGMTDRFALIEHQRLFDSTPELR